MIPKKTAKADLRNKRGLFFQIGLCVSLLLAILIFMQSQPAVSVTPIEFDGTIDVVVEMPPITRPPEPERKLMQPKITQIIEIFRVVPNEYKIQTLDFPSAEDLSVTFGPVGQNGTSGIEVEVDGDPMDYMLIEEPPLFQGKDVSAFRVWVNKQLKYPILAEENGLEGRVTVRFVIDRSGNLTDIEIIASPDRSFSEEVVRVLKLSPAWTPGKHRGRPVPVRYNIPVDFKLQ